MKPGNLSALCLALLVLPAAVWAHGKAHQHGIVNLDIGIEAQRLTVNLSSPLDNLIGFERAPRNDAERQRAQAAIERLRAADGLFTIDPAAQCRLDRVELVSPALGLGPAPSRAASAASAEHADLDASFEFVCADATRAAFVEVSLFAAFSRMQRLDVQVAAPKGQLQRTLKRPARRIELGR